MDRTGRDPATNGSPDAAPTSRKLLLGSLGVLVAVGLGAAFLASPPREPLPGETTTDSRTGIELAYIPAGTFIMGSPPDEEGRLDDEVQHQVTLTRPFWMGTTEVTNAQFQRFVEATGRPRQNYSDDPTYNGTNQPAVGVRWEDAAAFAAWADMSLPTEAQWEYAARAGTETAYGSGDSESDLAEVGWYEANSGGHPHPVGELPANAWGLHDMHGNVWEWCADWYGPYLGTAETDPTGAETGPFPVRRGGFWDYSASDARSARRYYCGYPGHDHVSIGFRVARAIP